MVSNLTHPTKFEWPTKWYEFTQRFPFGFEDMQEFDIRMQDGKEYKAHYEMGYLYICDQGMWRRPDHEKKERLKEWLGFEDPKFVGSA